ncbi:glycosyl hydrolase [Nocardioides sp. NPDC058538]|uniref:glycosyl hydrolase n=1 Tax=Nocardioides sp. NPDC058538 TaxID=3346542 RepID=UPI003666E713
MAVRPKYRWWMPRAGTDPQELSDEIRAMKAAGAGGAEISPFLNPGGAQGTGQGLIQSGWMSEAWKDRLATMYATAAEEDFVLDDTMSGLGSDAVSVPTPGGLNAESGSKRLVSGYTILADSAAFDGAVPPTMDVSMTTALCAPASAGDKRIQPVITRALSAGDTITIGTGQSAQTTTVTSVGDGTWGCGRTVAAAKSGESRIFVSALAGGAGQDGPGAVYSPFNPGQVITIGSGDAAEKVTVRSIGRAPASGASRVSQSATEGATTAVLANASSFAAGRYALLGAPDKGQIVKVTAKGVDGVANQISFEPALTSAVTAGTSARDIGEGVNVTPLTKNHRPTEDVVVDGPQGDGIGIADPLTADRGLTTPVSAKADKTLTAALAYRCVATCAEAPKKILASSVVDLTADAADGAIDDTSWRTSGTWVVYVQQMVNDGPFMKGSFSPYGFDYAVDHLSSTGADALIEHWDEEVLTPQLRASIRKNKGGLQTLFEDSLEMPFTPKWTSDFLDEWQARRGYDLTPYLPALSGTTVAARPTSGPYDGYFTGYPIEPGNQFDIVGADVERIREDYRQTWSDLFADRFVSKIQQWAAKNGLGGRFQAYGSFPIDTSELSGLVSIPEAEALGFNDDVNTYSIVASGAHMSGTDTVSNECCASGGQTYRAQLTDPTSPMRQILQSYAGGVNQTIWHGFDYKTSPVAAWPGYHAWSPEGGTSSFSEAFGPRMPVWGAGGVKDINDAVARLSLVLRQGKPRYDLAVVNQSFGAGIFQGPEAPGIKADGPLNIAGLTTEFLSPAYLTSDSLRLWDGHRLFPDRSAYQALVLNNQATIRPDAIRRIADLVEDGLPLLVIGDLPARSPGHDPAGSQDRTVKRASARIAAAISEGDNAVQVVDEAAAPAALAEIGVTPTAGKDTPSTTLNVRRSAPGVDYYYLYNNSDAEVSDTWTLRGAGRPYVLDQWKGTIAPLGEYEVGGGEDAGTVEVPVTIGARDATVIAISKKNLSGGPSPKNHVTDTDADKVDVAEDGTVTLRSATNRALTATLADGGKSAAEISNVPQPQMLSDWTLSLESWEPGTDKSAPGHASTTVKVDKGTFDVKARDDGKLPGWRDLVSNGSLDQISGIGAYTATVKLPANGWTGGYGAYLDLGNTNDSARLTVNGKPVPVNQQDRSHIDLGPYLKGGTNQIQVIVASTLNNAANGTNLQDYGLLGPVVLRPYGEVPAIGRRRP